MKARDVMIKRLRPNAVEPAHGSQFAAGYDLFACIDEPVAIEPHQTKMIGTGWAMQIPEDTAIYIFARSGLASKKGLRPANCVGVIDADYRGEYMVALHNDSKETRVVTNGERIAQAVLGPYYLMNFVETKELDSTERGAGGFGSTGK